TYRQTLANLHILDYDYYFRVVDALLAENHTDPLLILDEILRKGFDGHNFIVGLGEHLRNLLVSQDSRTVKLMEVPESVQQKYHASAIAASSSLLLTWLNLSGQGDINYKTSKDQRRLIELWPMKMGHLHSVPRPSEPAEAGLKKKLV